jgi:hypothetical protein
MRLHCRQCSLTGEESVTEAGVSFASRLLPVAIGGRGCSPAFEVECLHEEASLMVAGLLLPVGDRRRGFCPCEWRVLSGITDVMPGIERLKGIWWMPWH